jgi:nucleoside phosphorylase
MKSSDCDLLIFSARPEELWFLEQHFKQHLKQPLNTDIQNHPSSGTIPIQVVNDYYGLKICLVCLNGMGNVAAAIKAHTVINTILPKSVIMVGLAAAVPEPTIIKGGLNLGSVGISNKIDYYSFGKVVANKKYPEVRHAGNSKTLISNEVVGRLMGQEYPFQTTVNNMLVTWWNDPDFNKDKWVNGPVLVKDRPSYSTQIEPSIDSPVNIDKSSRYVSGEHVVSDSEFVAYIVKEFGGPDPIKLIDMESYGISMVCDPFNIPYLTIKGASDFAGGEKDDKHRWKSIAAASATCICLMKSNFFKELVVNNSEPIRQSIPASCLIPNVSVPCPSKNEIPVAGLHNRKCLDNLKFSFPSDGIGKIGCLSRVHENILPDTYSKELANNLLKNYAPDTQRLTLFFPYSAEDLLDLFAGSNTQPELIAEIRTKFAKYAGANFLFKSRRKKQLIEKIRSLIDKVKGEYAHFGKLNSLCKGLTTETIPNVSRIIILGREYTPKEIEENPLNIIYPLFLGENVRTYYTTTARLQRLSMPFPDAIYVSDVGGETKHQSHIVLRYFDKSHSLIVSGVPCDTINNNQHRNSPDYIVNFSINQLFKQWDEWIKSDTRDDEIFRPFPNQELMLKYA